MAELLIKAVDYDHPEWFKDRKGAWKRGMVVVAKPNGWKWGRAEGPPKFIVVKVPELPLHLAEERLCRCREGQVFAPEVGWTTEPIRRRQKAVDITGLTHGQTLTLGEFMGRVMDGD